jgi:hypothetical protein
MRPFFAGELGLKKTFGFLYPKVLVLLRLLNYLWYYRNRQQIRVPSALYVVFEGVDGGLGPI